MVKYFADKEFFKSRLLLKWLEEYFLAF